MDFFPGLSDPLAYGLAIVCFGGWAGLLWMVRLMFTGKLCSGRELDAVAAEKEEWKKLAFRLLIVTDRTTGAAEILHDVAQKLPDPAREVGQ